MQQDATKLLCSTGVCFILSALAGLFGFGFLHGLSLGEFQKGQVFVLRQAHSSQRSGVSGRWSATDLPGDANASRGSQASLDTPVIVSSSSIPQPSKQSGASWTQLASTTASTHSSEDAKQPVANGHDLAKSTPASESASVAAEQAGVREGRLPLPTAYDVKTLQAQLQTLQRGTLHKAKHRMYMWWINTPDGRGEHFFWPAASTVIQGLADWKGRESWEIVVTLHPSFKFTNLTKVAMETPFERGDVLIWYGNIVTPTQQFVRLRRMGVYIIYFQTEPIGGCAMFKETVDEMWDFSWKSIDACRRHSRAPFIRYVPSGLMPTRARTVHLPGHQPAIFFGVKESRPCWNKLRQVFGEKNLIVPRPCWGDACLADITQSMSIFVNFPKACSSKDLNIGADAHMTSLRVSILLSTHAILLSSHAYAKDEAEYRDIIPFVPLPVLNEEYERVAKMAPEERRRIAERSYELYARKFHPAKILERAGIYELFERLASTGR